MVSRYFLGILGFVIGSSYTITELLRSLQSAWLLGESVLDPDKGTP